MKVTAKLHDTNITFKDTPLIDGVPVPPDQLADCTLSFIMKLGDATATKKAATINSDGTFQYNPDPDDVATAGSFKQEWELVYPSGKILTFPNNGYNVVEFIPDLG
jgi:hypothetical protein